MTTNESFGCIVRMKAKPGHEDAFRKSLAATIDHVERMEPGTAKYEWFLDEAGENVVLREWFHTSAAALPHFTGDTATKFIPDLLQYADLEGLDVTGSPSDEVRNVLDNWGARYMPRMAGFTR